VSKASTTAPSPPFQQDTRQATRQPSHPSHPSICPQLGNSKRAQRAGRGWALGREPRAAPRSRLPPSARWQPPPTGQSRKSSERPGLAAASGSASRRIVRLLRARRAGPREQPERMQQHQAGPWPLGRRLGGAGRAAAGGGGAAAGTQEVEWLTMREVNVARAWRR
jgi:hypothetical protein